MEKFIIGVALGCLAGALFTANNYKMRTLVRKGQEEVATKLDKMLDEKIQTLEKGANKIKDKAEEQAEELENKVKSSKKKSKSSPKTENT